MSNIKQKISKLITKTLGTLALFALVVGGGSVPASAAYNATAGRYDDTLTNPHQEAVYVYNYENTSPDAAPAYFEIPIGPLTGANPDALIEITSITDTFPVDATTFVPTAGAQTITTPPASAVYVNAGTLYVRISPQVQCTASSTGCTTANLPAAVPGKITIKASIKTSAPITPSIIDGQGKIVFPNGYDINAIGWRINVNYTKTNDVLDPSVMPTAQIKAQNGTSSPVLGQPYTVVTSGIKAVDGNPLNAPNGTCKSVVSGTTYTGTGITNGVCTIAIPINAPATIPGGTVNLNDGGTPRAIVLNNIPYSSATPNSDLTSTDIPGLAVTCATANTGSTTTCNFTLPTGKTLPTTFKLGIGTATPAGTCTAVLLAVSCTGVPTGSAAGLQPIYGQIGAETKVDTGEKVQINSTGSPTVITPITPITIIDLTNLNFNCGTSNTVTVNSTATCTGTLPTAKSLDPSNPLKLSIGDATTLSDTCTATGQTITCANVPTGSTIGSQPLKAKLGNSTLTPTGTNVNVQSGSTQLTQADIPNLNTLANITCNPDPAPINTSTTCSGTLPATKSAPVDGLKLNVEGQSGVTCTFSGQTFICSNMPVGSTKGNKNIQGAVGSNTPQNTGKTINVGSRLISDADLPKIGTGTQDDPFVSLTCGAQDIVSAGRPTTCYGVLKDGWAIPTDFKLGIGTDPSGTCTQSEQNVTCVNVPVTSIPENRVPVKAQIGSGPITNTGKVVAVQAVGQSLTRTGGMTWLAILGLCAILAITGGFAYSRKGKITNLNLGNTKKK